MRPITFFLALLPCATVQARHSETEPVLHPSTLRGSDWFEHVTTQLRRAEYEFSTDGTTCRAWSAPNRVHALRTHFTAEGIEIVPRERAAEGATSWTLSLRTHRFGRLEGSRRLEHATATADGESVRLDHGPLTEWFVNRPDGLEQGWTVDERPTGDDPLAIQIALGGGFRLVLDDDVRGGVIVGGDVELPYRGLVAFDANGRDLDAWLEVLPSGFRVVVDDTDATYPLTVDPVLTGPEWTAESNQQEACLGMSVAAIGDVNGDGYDDIAVSAPFFDAGQENEGRVWAFYCGPSGPSTSSSWFIESNQAEARCGHAVAGAGDINGDGYDDLIVSAPNYDSGQSNEGVVWAYYGSSSGLPTGSSWFADGDQTDAAFGLSLSAAGDVDSDGYDDIIVGAPAFDDGEVNEGKVFVYFGTVSGLSNTAGWTKTSDQAWSRFGDAVAGAGDMDGDGYDDILVGAPNFDGPEIDEGRVWRFDGSFLGLPAGSSEIYESDQQQAGFGHAVAGVGDVNGDGYDDIMIGAPDFDAGSDNEGRAWVFHGGVFSSTSSDWYGESDQQNANYGWSVAGAGDVNGDGYDDVIVSAYRYANPNDDEGRVWMHLGTPSGVTSGAFWTGEGNQTRAKYGFSIAGVGDVNGDGFDDVVVGASGFDAGQLDEGRAFFYAGSDEIGTGNCVSTPNSTGSPAVIRAFGSPSAAVGNLRLEASPVPNGFGLFLHAGSSGFTPLGDGFLCISGSFVRGPVVTSTTNLASFTYDNSSNNQTLIAYAGTTRYFQAWFRDTSSSGFNLSSGVAVPIYQ